MPSRRRRRVIEKRPTGPPTREEMEALEERLLQVERKARMGLGVSPVLSGDPDGDDSWEWTFDAHVPSADDATTVGGYIPDEIPYITDGAAPGSSPTPTVTGGPRYFAVKWTGVANADLVTYEVHVSATPAFTADATTLAGETPGGLAYIRKLPDDTDFIYETDYYFQLIAKDEDGSAAASAEVGPVQLDPNGTDDILAGAVTAEKLEAVLAMASAILAGTFGGANVQVGLGVKDDGAGNPILDTGFLGIRAYDGSDGEDPTFKLDGSGGTAQFKGRVRFGSNALSKLTTNDMVQLEAQPGGSWNVPSLLQSNSTAAEDASAISCAFEETPTLGNEIIVVVTSRDPTGAPTHTIGGTGWTSVRNNTFQAENRQTVYRRTATADGNDNPSITFDKNADLSVIQVFEFFGVQDVEDATGDTDSGTGSGSPAATGPTGTVTQDGIVLGFVSYQGNFATPVVYPQLTSSPADYTQIGQADAVDFVNRQVVGNAVYLKAVSGSTHSISVDLEDVDAWRAAIVSLKAQAVAVEPAEVATARLYTKDVGGTGYLHSVDENGLQSAVVLGEDGEVWRLEYVTDSLNLPSVAGHSSTTVTASIPSLAAGDLIFYLGRDAGGGAQFKIEPESPVCTTPGEITLRAYNADAATADPGAIDYHFIVIHRS